MPMLAFVQDNMTCTAFLKKPRPGYKEWVTCLRLHCVTDLKLTIVKNSWWPPLGGDWAKKLKPTWGSSCNTKSPPGVADKGKGSHQPILYISLFGNDLIQHQMYYNGLMSFDRTPIRALIMVKDMICFVATKQKVQYIFSSWQTSPVWTCFTFF